MARGFIEIHDVPDSVTPEDDHARIALTHTGRKLVEQIHAASEAVENELMQQLGVPETIALRTLLCRFVRTYHPAIPYKWF